MARRRNPVSQWLAAWLSLAFARLTSTLPVPVCRTLGRVLGRLAYYVVPRIRDVGLRNLDLAYGDSLDAAQKRRILMRATENVGIVAAEFSKIPKLRGDFVKRWVTISGLEQIDFNRGGLLVSAHMGNWEWMGPAFHGYGYRVAEIVRPLDHPKLQEMVDGMRSAGLDKIVDKEGAGPELIQLLREGWFVGVLIDQSPRTNGVPVRFFDVPCWATVAPVMAAARARVPVYGVSLKREADGRYTLAVRTRIEIERSKNFRQDVTEYTQRCQDFIEAVVRECPEQWLWLHRRWKERPRLQQERDRRAEREAMHQRQSSGGDGEG